MSNIVREDVVLIKFDSDTQSLNNVENGIDNLKSKTTSGFKTVASSIGSGLKTAAVVGVKAVAAGTAAVGGLMAKGIAYNNEMQSYTTSFKTMLGSTEKADEMVGKLKSMADTTPFEMTDMASAAQTLLGFGVSAEKVMPSLQAIGDVAQGDSAKFDSLSLAFAQVQAAGKLTGQDLLQMINAGFNPLQTMSEKTGKSIAELKEEMSKGAISAEMVAQAFTDATSEGGRFYKAMENQSKTFSGQMSTISDNANSLLGALTAGLQKKLAEGILPKLNEELSVLNSAFDEGGMQGFIDQLPKSADKMLTSFMDELTNGLPTLVTLGGSMIGSLATAIVNSAPKLIDSAFTMVSSFVSGLASNMPQITAKGREIIKSLLSSITSNLPQLVTSGIQLIGSLAVGLIQAIPDVVAAVPNVVKAIWDGFKAVDWVSLGKQIISAIWDGIKSIGGTLKSSITSLVESGSDMMSGLAKGINNGKGEVTSAVKDVAKSTNKTYTNAQKIKSPSRVWAKFGAYQTEGLANELEDTIPTVKSAVRKVSAVATPASGGYTPASGTVTNTKSAEYNSYAPQFNLTISGSNDDRILARKVKNWVRESMNETFESMGRKTALSGA